MCGGAECPEPAARVRARGRGVHAGAESDHQGSHGPVVTSAAALGKAEQAGFLQGVGIPAQRIHRFFSSVFLANGCCAAEHLVMVSCPLHTFFWKDCIIWVYL